MVVNGLSEDQILWGTLLQMYVLEQTLLLSRQILCTAVLKERKKQNPVNKLHVSIGKHHEAGSFRLVFFLFPTSDSLGSF